jgi:hypothetical protein
MRLNIILKTMCNLLEIDEKDIIIYLNDINLDIEINDKEINDIINKLLDVDKDINELKIKSNNFTNLKKNLIILQIKIILNKIKEKNIDNESFNKLIELINKKLTIINDILYNRNDLHGGSINKDYYNKYLKYKKKYILLKNIYYINE